LCAPPNERTRRRGWIHPDPSRILRHAPGQYTRSFLLTETDERDATYFIAYQLDVVERAVEQLHDYLRQKTKDVRDVEALLKNSDELDDRQFALLANALRVPDGIYTFQTHAASHGVTHETARTDLLALVEMGFLEQRRQGRRHTFTPPADFAERLGATARPAR
jgi:Fic family protein